MKLKEHGRLVPCPFAKKYSNLARVTEECRAELASAAANSKLVTSQILFSGSNKFIYLLERGSFFALCFDAGVLV